MDVNKNHYFRNISAGLPEDIERLKQAGYITEAIRLIDRRLDESWVDTENRPKSFNVEEVGYIPPMNPSPILPLAMRESMLAQREMMKRLAACYPYSREDAINMAKNVIPDFTADEFDEMVADDLADWRFIDGEKRFSSSWLSTQLGTNAGFAKRAGCPHGNEAFVRIHNAMDEMKKNGYMKRTIALRATIKAKDEVFEKALSAANAKGLDHVLVKAWLPVPTATPAQSNIKIKFNDDDSFKIVSPENSPARTVYFSADIKENREFCVEYEYTQVARYTDIYNCTRAPYKGAEESFGGKYLKEELPHIEFTPYLKALVAEITNGCETPIEKARKIYDFISLNVRYRYMPEYFELESIGDRCIKNRRGDCGVMALAFITMCRIAEIPARWESGLSAKPEGAGCHDWARFYIEEFGWIWCDPSYGAMCARMGDEEGRLHYFGNLDAYRMVANSEVMQDFDVPMMDFRIDPCDNQMGEMEIDGRGLKGEEVEAAVTSLKMV